MAIRIDPAVARLPERIGREVAREIARGRGPLAEAVLPLNAELLEARAELLEARAERDHMAAIAKSLRADATQWRIHQALKEFPIG